VPDEGTPPPTAGGGLAGLPAQAGPLATIATIVVAAVMQQYTANTNHTTTNDDLDSLKKTQTEIVSKVSILNDQLAQVSALKAAQGQLDSRVSTGEQGLVQLQADLKRDERRIASFVRAQTQATPYVPVQSSTPPANFEPQQQNQPPKHR